MLYATDTLQKATLHSSPFLLNAVLPPFLKQKSTLIERPTPRRLLDLLSIDRALGALLIQKRKRSSFSETHMI